MTGHRLTSETLTTIAAFAAGGLVALAIGLAVDNAGKAVGILLTTLVAGAVFFLLFVRPQLARALAGAREVGAVEVRGGGPRPDTVRIVLLVGMTLLAFLSPSVAGLLFGVAVAELAALVRVRAWERRAGRTLVRVSDGYVAAPSA